MQIFKINFKSSLTKRLILEKSGGDQTSLKYLNGINKKFKNNFHENFFFKRYKFNENKILKLIKFYGYPKDQIYNRLNY